MSGAPKRLHEEGGHSTPLKRPIEETGNFSSPGKFIQPGNNDFHVPFEHGQEGRMAKVQRVELRDSDKRFSQLHRMSSVPSNSTDHPITSETRLELKNSKDSRDVKNEIREVKSDSRVLYSDTRVDAQLTRIENDARVDGRTNDKDLKSDKISHSDYKSDLKFEMDSWTANTPHTSWKDHHKGKRYYEPPADGLESWRARGFQSTDEVAKEPSIAKDRDLGETQEAVGENKVDVKIEEKMREKERKRKDDKHRDFGEKDKHSIDRRSNVQIGGPSSREERENDKWDRDRKDFQKEKERNERDKEPVKRESSNVNEKETLQLEKEHVDGSASRAPEQENTLQEYKRVKEESWKGYERDTKEKKREKDLDIGDRHEQRAKGHEKEPDDGGTEGYGATEKEKETFGGVQIRRRMSRSRGTPQASNREPRFRSRTRDSEMPQGKPETSAIVYKPGECMQELLNSWKEFEASQGNKEDDRLQNGPALEIRIPAEFVTSTNRQVKGAQLWGTDVYTNDSDLVAVLMHTGYCCLTSSPPPSAIQELRVIIRVLPPKDCYTSTLRNNVRSRAWGQGIGCSYRVERCCIVKKGGGTIDLEPCLTHSSAVEPTLAPVSVERTMTTRAAASNALRQQRFVREVTIQYNLCNEPWLKYSISIVADKGLKKPLYTSARLKKGEVLYLETHFNRYELCFNGEKSVSNGITSTSSQTVESEHEKLQNPNSSLQNGDRNSSEKEHIIDVFRWSRCKRAFPENIMRKLGIPLPAEHLEILEENLDWEDVQWSQTGVWVAGKEYALARVHFLSQHR